MRKMARKAKTPNVMNLAADTPVPAELRPGDGQLMYFSPIMGGTLAYTDRVSPEASKKLATAYRCMNVISDDVAGLPLQQFKRLERGSQRVKPDGQARNMAYLVEVQPNRWNTPFMFKKGIVLDLLGMGNAYIWRPISNFAEIFKINPRWVSVRLDAQGNRYFLVRFPNGKERAIPDPEMMHLMINPDPELMIGRSVLAYAAETMNRQANAGLSRNKLHGNGLLPSAVLQVNGTLDKEAREIMKRSYIDAAADGVAVMDSKIAKFEVMTMKATDAQFLEGINATDREIANFYGVPEYKLNAGKQSYSSNEQQQLDYLGTTLNPYLIQIEQAARLSWLSMDEQAELFYRFERRALLQVDAKTQGETIHQAIIDGIYSINDARAIYDMEPFEGGDAHYFPLNMGMITKDGLQNAANTEATNESKVPEFPAGRS